jgi:hypothetical protein
MNNDPNNRQAKARSDLGITRLLEQTRKDLPHPSRGGTRGYPVWYRVDQLGRWLNNEPMAVDMKSIYRWAARIDPHRMTGNKEKE